MKKVIINRRINPIKQTNAMSSLYNSQLLITYGTIDSNNTNGTTNVLLVTGFVVANIRILSTVFPSKDPTIGGIRYPQVGAQVIVIHPQSDIGQGFIIPASLDERDNTVTSDLLNQGDKELLQGGWETAFDPETGIRTLKNGNFNLVADPNGQTVVLDDFSGNNVTMEASKVTINGNLEVLQ